MKKLFTLLLCLSALGASATIWRLNNNLAVDADFRTFSEAQEAASEGDTIFVEGNGPANHYGFLWITKKLILIGPGYFLTENDSTFANKQVAVIQRFLIDGPAEGTELHGLAIENESYWEPHQIWASNVLISRCFFKQDDANILLIDNNVINVSIVQSFLWKVNIDNPITASNLLIINNYIGHSITLNTNSSGIIAHNVVYLVMQDVYNSSIKNNIILSSQWADPFSAANGSNDIAYNLVAGSLPNEGLGMGNQGGIDMSTVFAGYPNQGGNSSDGRFMLSAESPALGAGENGIDCGMFGGLLPYVLSGQPAVPRVYEAVVPTAGSTSAGLPVIIKIKSQN